MLKWNATIYGVLVYNSDIPKKHGAEGGGKVPHLDNFELCLATFDQGCNTTLHYGAMFTLPTA